MYCVILLCVMSVLLFKYWRKIKVYLSIYLLSIHGYAYVFNNPSLYDVNTFVSLFKQTLIDTFKQTWCNDKAKRGVLKLYDNIKNTLDYEQYLNVLPHDLRFYVTRLRVSAHYLRIHTGRYATNNTQRYCMFCNSRDLEDEYHFILFCPCYIGIRKKIH